MRGWYLNGPIIQGSKIFYLGIKLAYIPLKYSLFGPIFLDLYSWTQVYHLYELNQQKKNLWNISFWVINSWDPEILFTPTTCTPPPPPLPLSSLSSPISPPHSYTVKPVFKGHLKISEKVPYMTGPGVPSWQVFSRGKIGHCSGEMYPDQWFSILSSRVSSRVSSPSVPGLFIIYIHYTEESWSGVIIYTNNSIKISPLSSPTLPILAYAPCPYPLPSFMIGLPFIYLWFIIYIYYTENTWSQVLVVHRQ